MASTLASQLQQLAAAQNPGAAAKPNFRGKASLLFDFQKAADVDVQSIFEIACQGLDELVRKDPRFRQYKESLFSRASLNLDPDQQTADVLQKLDDTIQAFCAQLCDHFLSPSAFKVLEFLIRRFKANERNVDALLLCALPYHSTNEFVRLVQTLSIGKGLWNWMGKMQESGASMPRQLLVKRCINDKPVLHFVCQSARYHGLRKAPCGTFLSFYAVLLCEVSAGLPSISEDVLSQLLSYLVDGLSAEASPDYRSATLMAIAELCSRAQMGRDFLKAVCGSMLKHVDAHTSGAVRTTLLMLSHVAATQPQLQGLSEKSIKYVLALPGLHGHLTTLSSKGVLLAPLVSLLARSLVSLTTTPGSGDKYLAPLLELIHANVLSTAAKDFTAQLLALGAGANASSAEGKELRERCVKLLRALDLRYPTQVDAAVNAVLTPLRGASPSGSKKKPVSSAKNSQDDAEEPSSSGEEDEEADTVSGALSAEQHALFALVKDAFMSSGAAPCGDSMMTLAAALMAPAAGIRSMALRQLDEQLRAAPPAADSPSDADEDAAAPSTSTSSSSAHAYLLTAALARLQDDDLSVVEAALSLHSLPSVAPAALADALLPLLTRLSSILFTTAKYPETKQARAAAAAALPLLAGLVPVTNGPVQDSVVLTLLGFLLPTKHDQKLAVTAADAIAKHCGTHALLGACLAGLAGARQAGKAASTPSTSKSKKTKSRTKEAEEADAAAAAGDQSAKPLGSVAVQSAVVEALGGAAAQSAAALAELCRLSEAARSIAQPASNADSSTRTASLRARHVLSQALCCAQRSAGSGSRASVAHALVQLSVCELCAVVPSLPEAEVQSWQQLHTDCFDAKHLPTAKALSAQVKQLPALHAALLCGALKSALEALPEPSQASAEQLQAAASSFASLAAISPRSVFATHLQLMVGHLVPADAATSFLARMYGEPTDSSQPVVQSAALHAQASMVTAASLVMANSGAGRRAAGAAVSLAAADPFLVVTLLPALRSPAEGVRKAAYQCLATLCPLMDSSAPLAAYGTSLLQQKKLLASDADACSVLTRNTLCNTASAPAAGAGADTSVTAGTPAKGQKKHGKESTDGGSAPTAPAAGLRLQLSASSTARVVSSLSQSLSDLSASLHGVNTAHAVLDGLVPELHEVAAGATTHEAVLKRPAGQLLDQVLEWWRTSPGQARQLHADVASQLLSIFTPSTAATCTQQLSLLVSAMQLSTPSSPSAASASSPTDVCTQQALAVKVRTSALHQCTPAFYSSLPSDELRLSLLLALLRASEGDGDEACRCAARQAIEALPLEAAVLLPALASVSFDKPSGLNDAAGKEQPKRKKGKKEGASPAPAAATAVGVGVPSVPHIGTLPELAPLPLAVLVLEMLQWKESVLSAPALVPACQALLLQLLPVLDSIATLHNEGADDTADDAEDAQATLNQSLTAASVLSPSGKSSLAGYAAQLALMTLDGLVRQLEAGASADAFELALVVRCAREAPDAAVRNAALSLLAALATRAPAVVLSHVLQVLAIVHQSAALQDDEHSRAVASTTLMAVVPAWVASGRGTRVLWEQVVASLHGLPLHRRFGLLHALLGALPQQEEGLVEGLLAMLTMAAAPVPAHAQTLPSAAPALADAPASTGKKSKKEKKAEAVSQAPSAAAVDAAAAAEMVEALPKLASQLAMQVELSVRMSAFAALLQRALAAADGQPHLALPRIAVAFVTAQLKMRSTTTVYSSTYRRPDADPALETACRRVMESAIAQVQRMVGEVPGSSASAVKLRAATRAAAEGLYALFGALQSTMQPDAFIQALLQLCRHPSDKVRARALKLLTARVREVRPEIEDLVELPQRVRDAKLRQAADAAMGVCALLPGLFGSTEYAADASLAGPLTRQLALVAAAAVAMEFAATHHQGLLASLPAIVAAVKDPHTSVRSSALAAIATFVKALQTRMIPLLPGTVAAVVAGADSSWQALSHSGPSAASASPPEVDMVAADAKDADEDAAGRDVASVPQRSAHEEAALELSSALAALSALVESLGAYLSPHLPQVLRLLLQPQVLACEAAGCNRFAATIRSRLPSAVPARLLLQPVFDRLQHCIDAGAVSFVALLDMVAGSATAMEAKVAAQFHEQIFLFLLRALDVRQRRPASLSEPADVAAAEAATLRALCALVMKLSEAKFKPLFLRLMEWASSVSVPETGPREPSYLGRMVSMFGAVNALMDKLRSVLVPYFRYLLDSAVQHLSHGEDGHSRLPTKKRAKKSAAASDASVHADPATDASIAVLPWLLRIRIVHALHRCFIHDNIGFVDHDKFSRLLQPLVSQLEAEPPSECLPLLSRFGADADLDAYLPMGKATARYIEPGGALATAGPAGGAAVRCLIALAVCVNSDAQWKPLNHSGLMLTRSGAPRVRALGLEVVAQLVERLREEYLLLLPEALPFVSELLEDGDAAVEARVQQVVKALEEVSGEKLDEYLKV